MAFGFGLGFGVPSGDFDAGVAAQDAIDAFDAAVAAIDDAGSAAPATGFGSTATTQKLAPVKGKVETFLDKNAGKAITTLIGLVTGIPVGSIKNPFVNDDGTPKGVATETSSPGIDNAVSPAPAPVKTRRTPVTPGTGVTDGDADRPSRRGAGRISRFGEFSRRTILTGSRGLSTKANTTKKTLLGL